MNHHTKKTSGSLTSEDMVNCPASSASEFPDKRTGTDLSYSMEDAAMGAFPVFFTQSPSFPAFQRGMEENKGKSNAQTLSGMRHIPCDNHIRNLSDEVHPSHIFPMFPFILNETDKSGCPDMFRSVNNNLLIAPDGTHYFSSDTICCENCPVTKHRNGKITYPHSAVIPVISSHTKSILYFFPKFIITSST